MRPLRGIVIGCGNMGANHARVLASMHGVLMYVVDVDVKKAQALSDRLRVGWTSDYHQALAANPDFAVIATPDHLHVDQATACLMRGMHVLIEKPVATSAEGAGSLLRLMLEHKRHHGRTPVVAVGHIERFNPAIVELKRQIAVGNAGTIYEVRCERFSPWPMRMKGKGVALDLATHDVDLLSHIVGRPVLSVERKTFARGEREDLVSALFEFEGGTIGSLHTNWLTPKKIRRVTVTASSGYFEANLITQELFFHQNGDASENELSALHGVSEGEMTGFCIQRDEPLKLELEDFIGAIRESRAPRAALEDGVRALELALRLQA